MPFLSWYDESTACRDVARSAIVQSVSRQAGQATVDILVILKRTEVDGRQ